MYIWKDKVLNILLNEASVNTADNEEQGHTSNIDFKWKDTSNCGRQEKHAAKDRYNRKLFTIFSLPSLVWKNKSSLMKSSCYLCVCLYPPLLTFECINQSLWNLVYHSTWAHLNSILHKSLPSVCVSSLSKGLVNPFPQQWIHATTEELLDMSFSIWPVSYQRKAGNQFFPELLVK
jgi:hypothetical protein